MKIALTLGLIVLVVVAVVVILNRKSGEKYEWLPSESAFPKYPMRIVKGDFILQDGSSIYIPDGRTVNNGWGKSFSTHVVGEAQKALPVKLAITWFSYAEDKFYTGEFDLPKEKIQQLFKEGVIDRKTGKQITYNRVIAGLAPEGGVSVWLEAYALVTEVANFQAHETDVDWKRVVDNPDISRQEFIQNRLEEALEQEGVQLLGREGVPNGLWKKYTQQFRWAPEIGGVQTKQVWTDTFNGEMDYTGSSAESDRREKRGVPQKISVQWQASVGEGYMTVVRFDEDEIFNAFSKFQVTEPDAPLKLLVEIDRETGKVGVSLRSADRTVRLEKIDVVHNVNNNN